MKLPRLLVLLLCAVALLGFSACGGEEEASGDAGGKSEGFDRVVGENEGFYVEVGELKYQVQLSRVLNPADVEDRSYLTGLDEEDQTLEPDTGYFGVFIRVENETDETHQTARRFYIEDTQGNEFEPIPVDNPLAYQPVELQGHSLIPDPNAVTSYTPTQGQLLLFKVPVASFDNRPLELHIIDPANPQSGAAVDLDV